MSRRFQAHPRLVETGHDQMTCGQVALAVWILGWLLVAVALLMGLG